MSGKFASIGAAAALALGVSTLAVSQTTPNEREVRVEASKVVVLKQGHSRTGIQNETVQLSRKVSFGDLDLGARSGEAELHRRISETATAVCKQLGVLYPPGSAQNERMDNDACVSRAVDEALAQMKPIVAAAREAEHE